MHWKFWKRRKLTEEDIKTIRRKITLSILGEASKQLNIPVEDLGIRKIEEVIVEEVERN